MTANVDERYDETLCQYVSSRGLLKSCASHCKYPISSIRSSNHVDIAKLIDGDTIYICSSALPDFVNRILPDIKTRFILLSGDSDVSVPTGILTDGDFDSLMNNPYLIALFSQNLVFSPKLYPKLRYLPIGLDYHTVANNNMWWGPTCSPKTQEQLLIAVSKNARSFGERKPTAYSTFHFVLHRGSRRQAFDQIPKELVYYEPCATTRLKSWKTQSEYAFVVSPPGEGLDCHRTWEALCLGCIPILISTPLDDMFEGLPVLIVKSWSDVTRELLDRTVAEYSKKEWCLDKLYLNYWLEQISNELI
jgi:hypothetical protein